MSEIVNPKTHRSPAELEGTLEAFWRDVLGVERIGRDDNFFDLGGDSLMAAKVHVAIRRGTGCEISLLDLFRYPTISSLAAFIARGGNTSLGAAGTRGERRLAVRSARRALTSNEGPR